MKSIVMCWDGPFAEFQQVSRSPSVRFFLPKFFGSLFRVDDTFSETL